MFLLYVLIIIIIIICYHDCIFINFYSNAVHKFPVYGTIKLYCIVLYCIVLYCIVLYCIVLYCIVLGAAMTLICYKIRLQIKYRSKLLKWFGPIFYFGRRQDEGGTLLCSKFRLQKKRRPNCNGFVLFFISSRNLEHSRVSPSSWRRPVGI